MKNMKAKDNPLTQEEVTQLKKTPNHNKNMNTAEQLNYNDLTETNRGQTCYAKSSKGPKYNLETEKKH